MAKLIIVINETNNAAFEEAGVIDQLVRIVTTAAKRLEDGATDTRLYDSNGNSVGYMLFEEDE